MKMRIWLSTYLSFLLLVSSVIPVRAASLNGSGGNMPAYYDAVLFTINFKEFSPAAEMKLHEHNTQFNIIYQSDQAVNEGFDFISVIDAIPGDGFNPIWEEQQIIFSGAPFQFFSDDEILAAAAAGTITLVDTEEMYRCSVVGSKK